VKKNCSSITRIGLGEIARGAGVTVGREKEDGEEKEKF